MSKTASEQERHLLRRVLAGRPRLRWFGLVAVTLLVSGWLVKDTSPGRWAASRTLAAGYALYDPCGPNSVTFGPADQLRPVAATTAEIQQTLAKRFADKNVIVQVDGAVGLAEEVSQFHHEDLRSPRVEQFSRDATDLTSAPDVFTLSARLRALTSHGHADGFPTETDPLSYLSLARAGAPLTCRPFAFLYGALCTTKGYTSRLLGLSRDGNLCDHAVSEVYVPQFHKWIVVDPDFNIAYRRHGEWLNARQLQQVWQALKTTSGIQGTSLEEIRRQLQREKGRLSGLTDVEVVVLGDAGEPLRQDNLRKASCTGMNLEFFEYVTYATRNDYLSHRYPYGHPARWKQYVLRADPNAPWPAFCPEGYEPGHADSLYWLVGRTVVFPEQLSGETNEVLWRLFTRTPNFSFFEIRFAGNSWQRLDCATLAWPLQDGANTLEARSVNLAGLRGETTRIEITLTSK